MVNEDTLKSINKTFSLIEHEEIENKTEFNIKNNQETLQKESKKINIENIEKKDIFYSCINNTLLTNSVVTPIVNELKEKMDESFYYDSRSSISKSKISLKKDMSLSNIIDKYKKRSKELMNYDNNTSLISTSNNLIISNYYNLDSTINSKSYNYLKKNEEILKIKENREKIKGKKLILNDSVLPEVQKFNSISPKQKYSIGIKAWKKNHKSLAIEIFENILLCSSENNVNKDVNKFLGFCYLVGDGVKKNIEKAVMYLKNSSTSESYFLLGIIYLSGYIEREDAAASSLCLAEKWFKMGAEKGHLSSQIMYIYLLYKEEEEEYSKKCKREEEINSNFKNFNLLKEHSTENLYKFINSTNQHELNTMSNLNYSNVIFKNNPSINYSLNYKSKVKTNINYPIDYKIKAKSSFRNSINTNSITNKNNTINLMSNKISNIKYPANNESIINTNFKYSDNHESTIDKNNNTSHFINFETCNKMKCIKRNSMIDIGHNYRKTIVPKLSNCDYGNKTIKMRYSIDAIRSNMNVNKLDIKRCNSAKSSYSCSRFLLNRSHYQDINSIMRQRNIFYWLKRISENKHSPSFLIYELAYCYQEGIGTEKDLDQAYNYFRKLVSHEKEYVMKCPWMKKSITNAKFLLARLASTTDESIDWLMQAAVDGSIAAQTWLGIYYLEIDSLNKKFSKIINNKMENNGCNNLVKIKETNENSCNDVTSTITTTTITTTTTTTTNNKPINTNKVKISKLKKLMNKLHNNNTDNDNVSVINKKTSNDTLKRSKKIKVEKKCNKNKCVIDQTDTYTIESDFSDDEIQCDSDEFQKNSDNFHSCKDINISYDFDLISKHDSSITTTETSAIKNYDNDIIKKNANDLFLNQNDISFYIEKPETENNIENKVYTNDASKKAMMMDSKEIKDSTCKPINDLSNKHNNKMKQGIKQLKKKFYKKIRYNMKPSIPVNKNNDIIISNLIKKDDEINNELNSNLQINKSIDYFNENETSHNNSIILNNRIMERFSIRKKWNLLDSYYQKNIVDIQKALLQQNNYCILNNEKINLCFDKKETIMGENFKTIMNENEGNNEKKLLQQNNESKSTNSKEKQSKKVKKTKSKLNLWGLLNKKSKKNLNNNNSKKNEKLDENKEVSTVNNLKLSKEISNNYKPLEKEIPQRMDMKNSLPKPSLLPLSINIRQANNKLSNEDYVNMGLYWLKKAASSTYSMDVKSCYIAQYILGVEYRKGRHVQQNNEFAIFWLQKALKHFTKENKNYVIINNIFLQEINMAEKELKYNTKNYEIYNIKTILTNIENENDILNNNNILTYNTLMNNDDRANKENKEKEMGKWEKDIKENIRNRDEQTKKRSLEKLNNNNKNKINLNNSENNKKGNEEVTISTANRNIYLNSQNRNIINCENKNYNNLLNSKNKILNEYQKNHNNKNIVNNNENILNICNLNNSPEEQISKELDEKNDTLSRNLKKNNNHKVKKKISNFFKGIMTSKHKYTKSSEKIKLNTETLNEEDEISDLNSYDKKCNIIKENVEIKENKKMEFTPNKLHESKFVKSENKKKHVNEGEKSKKSEEKNGFNSRTKTFDKNDLIIKEKVFLVKDQLELKFNDITMSSVKKNSPQINIKNSPPHNMNQDELRHSSPKILSSEKRESKFATGLSNLFLNNKKRLSPLTTAELYNNYNDVFYENIPSPIMKEKEDGNSTPKYVSNICCSNDLLKYQSKFIQDDLSKNNSILPTNLNSMDALEAQETLTKNINKNIIMQSPLPPLRSRINNRSSSSLQKKIIVCNEEKEKNQNDNTCKNDTICSLSILPTENNNKSKVFNSCKCKNSSSDKNKIDDNYNNSQMSINDIDNNTFVCVNTSKTTSENIKRNSSSDDNILCSIRANTNTITIDNDCNNNSENTRKKNKTKNEAKGEKNQNEIINNNDLIIKDNNTNPERSTLSKENKHSSIIEDISIPNNYLNTIPIVQSSSFISSTSHSSTIDIDIDIDIDTDNNSFITNSSEYFSPTNTVDCEASSSATSTCSPKLSLILQDLLNLENKNKLQRKKDKVPDQKNEKSNNNKEQNQYLLNKGKPINNIEQKKNDYSLNNEKAIEKDKNLVKNETNEIKNEVDKEMRMINVNNNEIDKNLKESDKNKDSEPENKHLIKKDKEINNTNKENKLEKNKSTTTENEIKIISNSRKDDCLINIEINIKNSNKPKNDEMINKKLNIKNRISFTNILNYKATTNTTNSEEEKINNQISNKSDLDKDCKQNRSSLVNSKISSIFKFDQNKKINETKGHIIKKSLLDDTAFKKSRTDAKKTSNYKSSQKEKRFNPYDKFMFRSKSQKHDKKITDKKISNQMVDFYINDDEKSNKEIISSQWKNSTKQNQELRIVDINNEQEPCKDLTTVSKKNQCEHNNNNNNIQNKGPNDLNGIGKNNEINNNITNNNTTTTTTTTTTNNNNNNNNAKYGSSMQSFYTLLPLFMSSSTDSLVSKNSSFSKSMKSNYSRELSKTFDSFTIKSNDKLKPQLQSQSQSQQSQKQQQIRKLNSFSHSQYSLSASSAAVATSMSSSSLIINTSHHGNDNINGKLSKIDRSMKLDETLTKSSTITTTTTTTTTTTILSEYEKSGSYVPIASYLSSLSPLDKVEISTSFYNDIDDLFYKILNQEKSILPINDHNHNHNNRNKHIQNQNRDNENDYGYSHNYNFDHNLDYDYDNLGHNQNQDQDDDEENNSSQIYAKIMYNLGLCYEASNDPVLMLRAMYQAGLRGHAKAQYMLAHHYMIGKYLPKSIRQAMYWLTASAEQGYANASYELDLLCSTTSNNL